MLSYDIYDTIGHCDKTPDKQKISIYKDQSSLYALMRVKWEKAMTAFTMAVRVP